MARDVNVSWVLPTTRESGLPLNPSDIQGVDLSISIDNTNYSLYNNFPANTLSTIVPELETGEWFFRGVVRDRSTPPRLSQPVVVSIVIPDDSPPGTLSSLTLTLGS